MVRHVTNAVKLCFTMSRDINKLSVRGMILATASVELDNCLNPNLDDSLGMLLQILAFLCMLFTPVSQCISLITYSHCDARP